MMPICPKGFRPEGEQILEQIDERYKEPNTLKALKEASEERKKA